MALARRVDGVLAAAAPPLAGRRSRGPARAAPRPATVPSRVDRLAATGYASGQVAAEQARARIRRRLAANGAGSSSRAGRRTPTVSGSASTSSPPWRPHFADVRAHQLGSFAIRRLRNLALPVPGELAQHELGALAAVHGAEMLPNQPLGDTRRVLIYGTGDGGEMIFRELKNNPEWHYLPIGFIDDDPTKTNKVIHGLRVYETNGSLHSIAKAEMIEEILISVRDMPPERLEYLRSVCREANVALKRAQIRIEPVDFE